MIEGLRLYILSDPMCRKSEDKGYDAHLVILNYSSVGSGQAQHILAWRVYRVGGHPCAIIDATSGKMLSYDNGIRY